MAVNFTATDLQVGTTVYFIQNNAPVVDTISRIKSTLEDSNADASAEQTGIYYLTNQGSRLFSAAELFTSASDLKEAFEDAVDAVSE